VSGLARPRLHSWRTNSETVLAQNPHLSPRGDQVTDVPGCKISGKPAFELKVLFPRLRRWPETLGDGQKTQILPRYTSHQFSLRTHYSSEVDNYEPRSLKIGFEVSSPVVHVPLPCIIGKSS
jgi:hypothetical protein